MESRWVRLHRLYDPEDLVRDREFSGEVRPEPGKSQLPRLSEEDFQRRVDEADEKRDAETW